MAKNEKRLVCFWRDSNDANLAGIGILGVILRATRLEFPTPVTF